MGMSKTFTVGQPQSQQTKVIINQHIKKVKKTEAMASLFKTFGSGNLANSQSL
jgi:hypothetical protein